MAVDTPSSCNIDLSDIQTSLVSRSSDAKLLDGRLIAGKVVERWNVKNCNKMHKQYVVTVKGGPTGMDDINVIEQLGHLASAISSAR